MTERDAERIELPGGHYFEPHPDNPRKMRMRSPNRRVWVWDKVEARAFAAAIRPEPSADAVKLVDAALRARTLYDEARTDVAHSKLANARAALLDHIARAEIERLRSAKDEWKRMWEACDKDLGDAQVALAAKDAEIERLNSDHERTVRLLLRSGEEINHKDAEIERLTKECDEDLADKEDDLDRFKAAAATMREQIDAKDAEIERLTEVARVARIEAEHMRSQSITNSRECNAAERELARLKAAQVPEELRKLSGEAVAGPWERVAVTGGWDGVRSAKWPAIEVCALVENRPVNASLIVAAVNFVRSLLAPEAAPAQASPDDALREAFAPVDDKDWDRLFKMIDDSGHGRFWNGVMRSAQAALNPTGEA